LHAKRANNQKIRHCLSQKSKLFMTEQTKKNNEIALQKVTLMELSMVLPIYKHVK